MPGMFSSFYFIGSALRANVPALGQLGRFFVLLWNPITVVGEDRGIEQSRPRPVLRADTAERDLRGNVRRCGGRAEEWRGGRQFATERLSSTSGTEKATRDLTRWRCSGNLRTSEGYVTPSAFGMSKPDRCCASRPGTKCAGSSKSRSGNRAFTSRVSASIRIQVTNLQLTALTPPL